MRLKPHWVKALLWSLLLPFLIGCSSGEPRPLVDYRSDNPQLSTSSPLSIDPTVPLLQELADVRLQRDGSLVWLELDASAETLWPRLKAFWVFEGFTLERDEPRIGLLQTAWLENRSNLPNDGVSKRLSALLPILYDSAMRDKYRLRLERAGESRVRLFLTHRGLEQVVVGDSATFWRRRPSDPELEAEMTLRLLSFLGLPRTDMEANLVEQASKIETVVPPSLSVTSQSLTLVGSLKSIWPKVERGLERLDMRLDAGEPAQGFIAFSHTGELFVEDFIERDTELGAAIAFEMDEREASRKYYRLYLQQQATNVVLSFSDVSGQALAADDERQLLQRLAEELK